MKSVLDKSCKENENTDLILNTFFSENCTGYDSEKFDGDQEATYDTTIWHIRVACLISKATCTYSNAHAPTTG
jgi:hypothetical protein